MARRLTAGQRAAARHAKARRGALKLAQEDLADRAVDASARTVGDFERGRRWPNSTQLVAIEKALGWRAGYLTDYAAQYDERDAESGVMYTDPIELAREIRRDAEAYRIDDILRKTRLLEDLVERRLRDQ